MIYIVKLPSRKKICEFILLFFPSSEALRTMTQAEIKLCSLLLQEHFGEIVEKIGVHLVRTGSQPLRVIAHDTKASLDQVCLDKRVCSSSTSSIISFKYLWTGELLPLESMNRDRLPCGQYHSGWGGVWYCT